MHNGVADDSQHARIPNKTLHKRIIVCCDGTWQDGISQARWETSNVLKLSRILTHSDMRFDPAIPQIVFYQSGIGTGSNIINQVLDGLTGASLGEKVQEAYAFIAANYAAGDEIFLFGFSRGAYTARMVAGFIGQIGVLSRKDMEEFEDLFVGLQRRGKAKGEDRARYDATLAPWLSKDAFGKQRIRTAHDAFTIKCVGVWDTVGSLGLPEEITRVSPSMRDIFGFPDRRLGPHIARGLHAMAIDETRADFNVCRFEMTPEGIERGQELKQCWFSGSHKDIGGGFAEHDLSDIALTWMVSNISDILAVDSEYLSGLVRPIAQWGAQRPHHSKHGIYHLSKTIHRELPTSADNATHEVIHPSVTHQHSPRKDLVTTIERSPGLLAQLSPLEAHVKSEWVPHKHNKPQKEEEKDGPSMLVSKVKDAAGRFHGKKGPARGWEARLQQEGMKIKR